VAARDSKEGPADKNGVQSFSSKGKISREQNGVVLGKKQRCASDSTGKVLGCGCWSRRRQMPPASEHASVELGWGPGRNGKPRRPCLDGSPLPPYDKKESFEVHFMTEPTYEELKARLADLEKQVETKKRSGAIDFRVSEKGGVSVYGLGRFPVTLYYEQWTRLLDAVPELKAFIEENKSKLKLKQG
jgi:hypothetical protein